MTSSVFSLVRYKPLVHSICHWTRHFPDKWRLTGNSVRLAAWHHFCPLSDLHYCLNEWLTSQILPCCWLLLLCFHIKWKYWYSPTNTNPASKTSLKLMYVYILIKINLKKEDKDTYFAVKSSLLAFPNYIWSFKYYGCIYPYVTFYCCRFKIEVNLTTL